MATNKGDIVEMSNKLYFRYGSMGAGKTLDFTRAIYNYKERGMDVLVYKSEVDTREGTKDCIIKSRTGSEVKGRWLPKEATIYNIIASDIRDQYTEDRSLIKAIFVDECQFLTETQVDELQKICMTYKIPVLCYGLLVDFQRHLFPGSKRLIEIADNKQELIGICHCGKTARQNARVVNGKMETEGDLVKIGGSNTDKKEEEDIYYVALCNFCYINKKID